MGGSITSATGPGAAVMDLIIAIYLYDDGASYLVLIFTVLSIFLELWKVTKVVRGATKMLRHCSSPVPCAGDAVLVCCHALARLQLPAWEVTKLKWYTFFGVSVPWIQSKATVFFKLRPPLPQS
eukprot:6058477-Amphidinium_carterae.1